MRLPLVFVLLLTGCATAGGKHVSPPAADRCARQADGEQRRGCEELKELAFRFARGLAVDDQVCLDGNPISDGVTRRCRVRAFVSDVAQQNVKLEIRDAPHDSRYKPMESYWFHEAAIADMYLAGQGY